MSRVRGRRDHLALRLLKFSRSDLASWRGFTQRAEISELDQSSRRKKINSGKISKFELFHAERTNMGTAFQALLMCFVSCPQQADLALLQDSPPKKKALVLRTAMSKTSYYHQLRGTYTSIPCRHEVTRLPPRQM